MGFSLAVYWEPGIRRKEIEVETLRERYTGGSGNTGCEGDEWFERGVLHCIVSSRALPLTHSCVLILLNDLHLCRECKGEVVGHIDIITGRRKEISGCKEKCAV